MSGNRLAPNVRTVRLFDGSVERIHVDWIVSKRQRFKLRHYPGVHADKRAAPKGVLGGSAVPASLSLGMGSADERRPGGR
jgi:hypothetical protein